jgi:oxygen-independent coproporphyrinogen III oxidase
MCSFETSWKEEKMKHPFLSEALFNLIDMEEDGLVEIYSDKIIVNAKGRPFVRNVCMAFDARLWRKQPKTTLFSATV